MAPDVPVRASDDSTHLLARGSNMTYGDWRLHAGPAALVLESWSEGFMLGALLIMICITIANLRGGVILHKLILTELCLAILHGTFCLMAFNGYGWYLSSTAALLYCSYFLHNVVAWIKIKPFFIGQHSSFFAARTCRWVQWIYISTLCLSIPPLLLQIFNNFRYFNNLSLLYKRVRSYEPLMRDPWWVWTNIVLLHIIRKSYGIGVIALIRRSPRLGILLAAICLALVFTVVDFCTSVVPEMTRTDGINPYWKLSLIFKCLTDSIMLDDFRTELKKISSVRAQNEEQRRQSSTTFDKNSVSDAFNEIEHVEMMDTHSMHLDDWPMTGEMDRTRRQARSSQEKLMLGRTGQRVSQMPSLDVKILRGIRAPE